MDLEQLKSNIRKASSGIHIETLDKADFSKIEDVIKTHALDLNRMVSGSFYGGFSDKSIITVVGPEHSFKSSLSCIAMAEAQRKGYKCIYIDTENLKDTFFIRWGIDPKNMLHACTPLTHEIMTILAQIKLSKDEKYFIVIDSVGGIERFKTLKDAEEGDLISDQGLLQKEIKRILKMCVNIKLQKSIIFLTGHYYGKPGMYGSAEEIGGGKALRLFSDVIISLKKAKIEEDDNVVGSRINAITLKNREYPPFNEGVIEIDYKSGINKYANIIDLSVDNGLVTKAGSWFTNTITGNKVQGKNRFTEEDYVSLLDKLDSISISRGFSSTIRTEENYNE